MDASEGPKYVVSWMTTETVYHVAEVDAETMAEMIGTDVATLVAAGASMDAVLAIDGTVGLENGLADIEDSDTEDEERSNDLEREIRTIHVKL